MAYAVVDAQAIEALHGRFRPLSEPLGLTAFKVNRIELPAGAEGPEHDHAADGQEEVYAVVAGSGVLRVDGEEIALMPGHFVFCSPEARRQMVAGDQGLTWIGIGAAATA
ncbi:MAG TPA: cupin domain-containing protein [Gaiellaceae bacterium]|nr:cupin domain-containing protein [Gaiellaceae bacterium]